MEGVVVDLAALDDRNSLVEEGREPTDDARFALATLAQENHVVAGKNRVFDFRDHRFVVAEDTG